MIKFMESKDMNLKDFNFKNLLDKYFKDGSNFDILIDPLNDLYKDMFWIDNNTNDKGPKSDELAFITNFRYGNINFLIGIYPIGTAGIISKVAIYTKKELLYPTTKQIEKLCNNTTIMNNTELYYNCAPENRSYWKNLEFKYELLVPNNTNFKFVFDLLKDITYGCENYDSTTDNFSKVEALNTLEYNIDLINKKLSSMKDCHIGDFLIGINDFKPEKVSYDFTSKDRISFYINEKEK